MKNIFFGIALFTALTNVNAATGAGDVSDLCSTLSKLSVSRPPATRGIQIIQFDFEFRLNTFKRCKKPDLSLLRTSKENQLSFFIIKNPKKDSQISMGIGPLNPHYKEMAHTAATRMTIMAYLWRHAKPEHKSPQTLNKLGSGIYQLLSKIPLRGYTLDPETERTIRSEYLSGAQREIKRSTFFRIINECVALYLEGGDSDFYSDVDSDAD